MFVFPESRLIIANEPDKNGKLVHKDGLFIGKLPENINIANTSMEWQKMDNGKLGSYFRKR